MNLASMNYRLSPSIQHPLHQEDVIAALHYLIRKYEMKQFILIGHSAGACLAFQSAHVPGCKGVIGVEGVYDLEELLKEYPKYTDIVEGAFGTDNAIWHEASPTRLVHDLPMLTVQLVQSTEDELLSARQTELMSSSLEATKLNVRDVAWIKSSHDDALSTPEFFAVVNNFIQTILDA